jgi:hypothetical protein
MKGILPMKLTCKSRAAWLKTINALESTGRILSTEPGNVIVVNFRDKHEVEQFKKNRLCSF